MWDNFVHKWSGKKKVIHGIHKGLGGSWFVHNLDTAHPQRHGGKKQQRKLHKKPLLDGLYAVEKWVPPPPVFFLSF